MPLSIDERQKALDQGSLQGTLTSSERSLPDQQDQLTKFKDVLRNVSLAATAKTRPTLSNELGRYKSAGVELTTPSAIQGGLEAGILGRREVQANTFAGVTDLLKAQEQRLQQAQQANLDFASNFMGMLTQNPALLASVSGEDLENIKRGVVPTELIAKISAAATTAEPDKFQFISGTENQQGGVFNQTTGTFTPGAYNPSVDFGSDTLSIADQKVVTTLADDLRQQPITKDYSTIKQSIGTLETAKTTPSAAGDIAMVFSYMKILDPNSTVREGEFATAENAAGIPDQIRNQWNKILINGERLGDEQRQDFYSTAKAIGTQKQKEYAIQVNTIVNRAEAAGVDPRYVLTDFGDEIVNNLLFNSDGSFRSMADGSAIKYHSAKTMAEDVKKLESQGVSEDEIMKLINEELGFNNDLSTSQNGSIGLLSERYESGGDPGAIGYDSTGGYSYGTYQLAHNNAKNFVAQSLFNQYFEGKPFNSQAFRDTWKEVSKIAPDQFEQEQKDYIAKTHFEPQIQKLESSGIQTSNLSPVLLDVIWSTAVQHGPNTPLVVNALKNLPADATDADKIKAIYKARWSGGSQFASSTPAVKQSVYNRFFGKDGEMNKALAMVNSTNNFG